MLKKSKAKICVCGCSMHVHIRHGRCKKCGCETFILNPNAQRAAYESKPPTAKQAAAVAMARAVRSTISHHHRRDETPTYRCWRDMMARCRNPHRKGYEHYGGRGITVCQAWHDFKSFLADMGTKPSGMEIDRKDVDGNYESSNCRWATLDEQANNKRNSRKFEYDGKSLTLPQWARLLGIPFARLRKRIKQGWRFEDAILKPPNPKLVRGNHAD